MASQSPTDGTRDGSDGPDEGTGSDGLDAGAGTDGAAEGAGTDGRAGVEDGPDPAADAAGAADRPVESYPLPPGPDGLPVLGNALQFLRDPFAFYETLAEYGDVVRWGLPGFPYTSLLHPDHVERVLVEEHDRFSRPLFEEFGFDFAPDGLLVSTGEQWRRQRGVLQPAFAVDRIRSYADAMAGYAEETADSWSDGRELALNRAFSRLTLRILSSVLFDLETDPDAEDAVVARAARAIDERADATSLSTFLPAWLPTPSNRRYERAMADFRSRVDGLIAARRETGATGDDLLSILLRAGGPDGEGLSGSEVRDNLLTFLFAGHETTSLGLTYAVLLLSQHDDARARLHDELESVLGGRTPTFEDVSRLSYTDRVVRESLRLHPPAHLLVRRATEDVVVGGYRIPEGTFVTLPQFHVHTDGRFFDDPDAFRPARWRDDATADRPEYAYFPFGGGPRHCIGMRFATLEMRLVLAVLAQRFEFELLSDPDPEISAGVTHRPKKDVRVRVRRRNHGS